MTKYNVIVKGISVVTEKIKATRVMAKAAKVKKV